MWIYFLAALISSYFLYLHNKKKNEKIFLILSFLTLFLLSSFRYGIGIDYIHIYVKKFYLISNGIYNWDIGAIAICKLVNLFSNDYIYFFAISAFITLFFIYKTIVELSDSSPICLFLFVISGEYIMSYNAVRQYIAIALFVYSLKFILRKDFRRYLFYIILASTMHSSAIFLLPLYFLNRIEPNKKNHLVFLLSAIALLPLFSTVFYSILGLTKYSFYLESSYNSYDPTYSELITFSIIYITSLIFYNKCKDDQKYRLLLNFELVSLIIALLSFKIILAYRVIFYFRFIQILMLVTISKHIKNKKNRLLFFIIFISMYSGITLIGGYFLNWYDTKYQSIFNTYRIKK